MVAGRDRMGLPPLFTGFVSIAAVLAPMPRALSLRGLARASRTWCLGGGSSFALQTT
jgi:hypothetical protein